MKARRRGAKKACLSADFLLARGEGGGCKPVKCKTGVEQKESRARDRRMPIYQPTSPTSYSQLSLLDLPDLALTLLLIPFLPLLLETGSKFGTQYNGTVISNVISTVERRRNELTLSLSCPLFTRCNKYTCNAIRSSRIKD